MSIYLTQLIYIKDGKEDIFDQFESIAIPAIAKYLSEFIRVLSIYIFPF